MAPRCSSRDSKALQSPAKSDWASLPLEILGSIVERLTVRDSLRFAAVCTSWATAAPPKNNGLYLPLAPQFPYLLLPDRDLGFILYSLPDNDLRRIPPIPAIQTESGARRLPSTYFCDVQHGWLILHDGLSTWNLLNPITRARIRLPFLSPSVFFIFKFFITPMPAPDRYAALALNEKRLFIARAGDDEWTAVETETEVATGSAAYHNNRFVVITYEGRVYFVDPTAAHVEMTLVVERSPLDCKLYLVESMDDLLLVVTRKEHLLAETITHIEVRRLLDAREGTWVPVESLADRSLFLGHHWCMSLSARGVPGLRPNCIYFLECAMDGKHPIWYVKIYNLEDGSMEICHPPRWLAVTFSITPFFWFTPALC